MIQVTGIPKLEQAAYETISNQFKNIENIAAIHREKLMTEFGVPIHVMPILAFNGYQSLMNTGSAIINGLLASWNQTTYGGPDWAYESWQRERAAQAMTVCRQSYIELLSLTEFSITHAVRNVPEFFPPPKGKTKIYLAQIISDSVSLGWLPDSHKNAWSGLAELRNALVHRNGISDKTASFEINDTLKLDFLKDTTISDKGYGLPRLCEWAVNSMGEWSTSYLKKASGKGWETFFKF